MQEKRRSSSTSTGKKEPRVVYLCLDGGTGPVESQVIDHLRLLWDREDAPRIDLFLFGRRKGNQPPSPLFSDTRIRELSGQSNGEVVIRSFSNPLSGVVLCLGSLLVRTFPVCFTGRLTIHGRAKDGGLMASVFKWLCLGRPRVVFDERGDTPSEYDLSLTAAGIPTNNLKARWTRFLLSRIEWLNLRSASCVFYVSGNLRSMVERRFPFTRRVPSRIFPCMADTGKFRFDEELRHRERTALGLGPDDRVLTYVGQLQPYQCFEETIELMGHCVKRDPRIRMLFITGKSNHGKVREHLSKVMPSDRFVIQEVPHDRVCGILNASDVGTLLRHPTDVNRAASPTKFAEYVLSGLPVVLTEGIGDSSAMVREAGLGVVLDTLKNLESAADRVVELLDRSHDPAFRRKIGDIGQQQLGRQQRLGDYIVVYEDLIARGKACPAVE